MPLTNAERQHAWREHHRGEPRGTDRMAGAKAWVARVNQAQLSPGLVRSERQPAGPPEVVEIWFIPLASWPSKSYQAGGVIGLIEPPIAEVTYANCYFCSRVNAGSGACCLRPNGSRKLRGRRYLQRRAASKFTGRHVVRGSRRQTCRSTCVNPT